MTGCMKSDLQFVERHDGDNNMFQRFSGLI